MGIEHFVVGVSLFLLLLVLLFTVLALLWPTWDSSHPQEVTKREAHTKNADSTSLPRKRKRNKHKHVYTPLVKYQQLIAD